VNSVFVVTRSSSPGDAEADHLGTACRRSVTSTFDGLMSRWMIPSGALDWWHTP
jgi:hypothetical protein